MGIFNDILERVKEKPSLPSDIAMTGFFGALGKNLDLIPKVSEKIKELGIGIARSIPRAITSVGIQPAAEILTAAGIPSEAEFISRTPFEKTVFGEEPIKGIFPRTLEAVKTAKEIARKALPSEAATGAAMVLGPVVLAGSLGLDLSPIGGGAKAEKKISEDIIKSLGKGAREIEISKLFHGSEAGKLKIDDFGNINLSPLKKGLERFGEVLGFRARNLKIIDVPDQAILFEAAKNPEIKQKLIEGGVDALKTGDLVIGINPNKLSTEAKFPLRAGRLKDKTIEELTKAELESRQVGNIRLDKFDLPAEDLDNLAGIIKNNQGFISQRRGVMSFFETEKLAEDIRPSIRLKKGSTLNAEEMQALGNTVVNLQTKVDDLSKLLLNPETNTDINLLKLAQAKEELSYALSSFAGARTEAGRSVSILRNINQAIASNDIDIIQKMAKSLDREETEALAKALISAPDNLAKINIVRNAAKIPIKDKIYEVFLNSILSNPLTQAVNTTSNVLKAVMNPAVRAIQVSLQRPGKREIFIGEALQQIIGFVEGMNDGVRRALHVFKNEITEEALANLDLRRLPAIGGELGKAVRVPTRLLSAVDEFFKAINETAEIRSMAYRAARKEGKTGEEAIRRMHELAQTPTIEMYEAAKRSAKEATFQQNLGKAGAKLISLRDEAPGLKYIIPFIRTPTNIAKDALKTSPLGYAEVIRKLATGKYKDLPANQITEDLAKATLGSIISIPAVMAALNGKITGAAPRNPAERDSFYREKEPYSIKIGDKWVSYRRLEPIGTVLGLIADFTQMEKEEDLGKAAANIATIIGQNLNDKTYLSSISATIDAVTDPAKTAKWYSNIISGAVPFSGTQRFVTRLFDPTIRKPEGVVETIMAQTPILSRRVRPLRTAFGEEVARNLSQIISPVAVVKKEIDLADAELSRLGIDIGFPKAAVQKIKLTDDEYDKMLKISGQTLKKVLIKVIQKSDWDKLSDGQKEKIIEQIKTRVRDRVKEKMFPEKSQAGAIRKRLMEKGEQAEEAEAQTEKIIQRLEEKASKTQTAKNE